MQLDTEHKRQVEEIIRVMECPSNFVCYTSGFENLSMVRIIGDAKLVECLGEKSASILCCQESSQIEPLILFWLSLGFKLFTVLTNSSYGEYWAAASLPLEKRNVP